MSNNVRKGTSQAKVNEDLLGVASFGITISAGAVGWFFESWFWFGGTLLGLMVLMMIREIRPIMVLIFALGWGLLAI